MSNHQGNTNANANANMRWGHGAAPDGTWEYGWAAGSFPPGGPTFAYASASASASASAGSAAGSGFGFSWGSGAAASGSAASSGPDHNHNHNQHGRSGQPFMHRPDYGASFYNSMPFREFPMGPVFGPPRSTYNNGGPRYDRRGRGGHGGGAGGFTRYF